ncbi:YojF family protein [Pseudogracilibacillus sp. SO30301A]|uniref:YojF family protein n=1 Tax=Pseudogracilibacillus sp. SO30301A TaxID=3098291 RepID=UPI00300E6090
MEAIIIEKVQKELNQLKNKPIYIHLETTNGAYASHFGNKGVNVGAYIRNAQITFTEAVIKGDIGHRVGLKTELGWVYAEGLMDYEIYEDKLLLAGHDPEGRLMVALQLSETPFK